MPVVIPVYDTLNNKKMLDKFRLIAALGKENYLWAPSCFASAKTAGISAVICPS